MADFPTVTADGMRAVIAFAAGAGLKQLPKRPPLPRGLRWNKHEVQPLTPAVVAELKRIVGPRYVIADEAERLEPFSHDEIPDRSYAHMPEAVVRPASAEQVAAARAAADRAWEQFAAARPKGYRGDGSGCYPSADPPVAWDLKIKANVLWRTPLPDGFVDPVLVGDRLIVAAEPHTLICLNKADGKELWRAECSFLELVDDAKWKSRPEAFAEYVRACRQSDTLSAQIRREKDPAMRAAFQKKIDETKKSWADMDALLKTLGIPGRHYHATATPVSDGRSVWAAFGGGVAACYDLDGRRKWMVATGLPFNDPSTGSPVLIGGRLVTAGGGGKGRQSGCSLAAFDAETGKLLWRAERPGGFGVGLAALRLGDGRQTADVVVTAGGQVLRAETGKVVHDDITGGLENNRCAPTVERSVVYFDPIVGESATRLWLDGDRVCARLLWCCRRVVGRGQASTCGSQWQSMRPMTIHDGLAYCTRIDTAHVPGHYVSPFNILDIYDADTGRHAAQLRPILRAALDPAIAPVMAGPMLLAGDGGRSPSGQAEVCEDCQMAVIERGELPLILSINVLDKMRANPVFEDNRMYVRMETSAACLSASAPGAARFQANRIAYRLFLDLGDLAAKPKLLLAEPPKYFTPPDGVPVVELTSMAMPDKWLFCGPLPPAEGDPLKGIGGEAEARSGKATQVTFAGRTAAFGPLDEKFIRREAERAAIDVLAAAGGQGQNVCYYYTVLDNPKPRHVQFLPAGEGAAAWLAGTAVRAKEVVRLAPGRYPLLVKVQLGEAPPFLMGSLLMQPKFADVAAPSEHYDAWLDRVRLRRRWLRYVADNLPGTEPGERALKYLEHLEHKE